MITHIRGKAIEKNYSYVIVDVHGLGYLIKISLNTYSQLNDTGQIHLHTHLLIRENQHVLYGFVDPAEREMFRRLIGISGVGPTLAILILSSLSPEEVGQAVLDNEQNTFKRIKGVGARTAQRILIELKDKIPPKVPGENSRMFQGHHQKKKEALNALEVLGFSSRQTEKILDDLLKQQLELSIEELIKQALRRL